ncbi:hypothetical protein [Aliiroseovarius sp.]|uniref:hypothetical protein n=1 Tax=Aliiroseovarius sp. TaxID=1872442 RepID=UPI003BABC7A9
MLKQSNPTDIGKRILHAASYQFGLVIKLALFAIEEALYFADTTLEERHFAVAFKNWKGCAEAFNPFLVNDFLQIDTQKMFTSEELV